MKAAVCREFGAELSIEEITLEAPQAGQVQVKLEACAICHSDIFALDGAWGGYLPAVFGHEAAGRISALGAGVERYRVGEPVLVTLLRSCGSCANCGAGHLVNCDTPHDRVAQSPIRLRGGEIAQQGIGTGAFAEQVVVDQSQIVSIPEDLAMDVASLLSCGVITGLGAVTNTARVRPGSTVAVIGAGGVGLNAIQGAVLSGCVSIIAMDLEEDKLDGAMEFGATHKIKATDVDAVKKVRAATGGRGVDYVFVTVGAIDAFQGVTDYLARRGEVILVGMPPSGKFASYEPVMVAALSQSIKGSLMGDTVLQRDIPRLIDLYKQGRLKLDELISNRYELHQINEAIAQTRTGKSRRNVIVF